jgi:hypothetical protein
MLPNQLVAYVVVVVVVVVAAAAPPIHVERRSLSFQTLAHLVCLFRGPVLPSARHQCMPGAAAPLALGRPGAVQ